MPRAISGTASAKASLAENSHGYRAGTRYDFALGGSRKYGAAWGANAGLSLARESAEKWNGEIEDCIHQNHVFRARPNLASVEPKFVSLHGNFFGQKL